MNVRDGYYTDLYLAFMIRFAIFACFLAILAMMLAGCSADSERSRAIDLAVKGQYVPGDLAKTRNQPPQGGIDEKSGQTPTEPSR
jgi:hypothetical protein